MLPEANPTRKQRFEAALKLADLTVQAWCDLHKISRQHLYLVFERDLDATKGREPSAELNAAIDATIEKYLGAPASVAVNG